jgi:hypothetical protein
MAILLAVPPLAMLAATGGTKRMDARAAAAAASANSSD